VLDARGEVIGLAFDGNKESLASDVSYHARPTTNSVCVDIRYVLWILRDYVGLDRVIEEIER
jgi:Peptidase S46.